VQVAAGDFVAVATTTPAGSTAVARTVAGLVAPVSGRIFVGDRDVTDQRPSARQTGYVPAGGGLLPHLTVRENIQYGLRRRETVREMARAWSTTVVTRLELVPTLHLRPHQLSAGQRLRAAIARAAVCLPEVLVVDLPSGVDGIDVRELLALASLPAAPPMAVLVCTADADATTAADRLVTV
jgi:ABC-type sugar transport system ATPase subunit